MEARVAVKGTPKNLSASSLRPTGVNATLDAPAVQVLSVGDRRRAPIGRAVLAVLGLAASFEVLAMGIKETGALESHAPWGSDPFDAFTSFALFFVPVASLAVAVRVPLCQRSEPLRLSRVDDVLRGARLLVAIILVTVASDWVSVMGGADRPSWSGVTAVLVAWLAAMSAASVWVALRIVDAGRALPPRSADPSAPDTLEDAITLASRATRFTGPLVPSFLDAIRAIDRHIAARVRWHPIASAGLLAAAFGVAIGGAAVREEGVGPIAGLIWVIAWCGMFGFLVAGGSYLGLVRGSRPLHGATRIAVRGLAAAALSVPIAVAYRDWLWWVVGSNPGDPTPRGFALLLVIVPMVVFALTTLTLLVIERQANSEGER